MAGNIRTRQLWRREITRKIHRISKILELKNIVTKTEFTYGKERFIAVILRLVYHIPKEEETELHSILEIRLYSETILSKFKRLVRRIEELSQTQIEDKSPYEILTIFQHYTSSKYSAYAKYWIWGIKKYKDKLPLLLDELARTLRRRVSR